MTLKVRLFSLLCIAANFNLIYGYSCKFVDNSFFGYSCILSPDDRSDVEQHVPGKTDDDVTTFQLWHYGAWSDTPPLSMLDVNICERFKNLHKIEFSNLKVKPDFLKGCRNLKELIASNIGITELPGDFLADNTKLIRLRLRNNNFRILPENLFAHQQELIEILLIKNQIVVIPSNIFKPAVNVKYIYLDENDIYNINSEQFKSLPNLRLLSLNHNKISDLPSDVFTSMNNLLQLSLHNNRLTTIHSDSFGINRKLKTLNLAWNKIEGFDEKLIDNTSLELLVMDGTPCIANLNNDEEYDGFNMTIVRLRLKKCFDSYRPRVDNCGSVFGCTSPPYNPPSFNPPPFFPPFYFGTTSKYQFD
ncbi:hypothetical protein ACKWTF_015036 [Chironomus riparius]